jgi:hypothetical protein
MTGTRRRLSSFVGWLGLLAAAAAALVVIGTLPIQESRAAAWRISIHGSGRASTRYSCGLAMPGIGRWSTRRGGTRPDRTTMSNGVGPRQGREDSMVGSSTARRQRGPSTSSILHPFFFWAGMRSSSSSFGARASCSDWSRAADGAKGIGFGDNGTSAGTPPTSSGTAQHAPRSEQEQPVRCPNSRENNNIGGEAGPSIAA